MSWPKALPNKTKLTPSFQDHRQHHLQSLVLLPHAPRRRRGLRRLSGAAHLPHLPQDGRRSHLHHARRRHQGQHLRGHPRKERRGHQVRRRPVLHATRVHQGHAACVAPPLPARARLSRSSSAPSASPWFNSRIATATHRPFSRASAARAAVDSGWPRSPASRCAIASASRSRVSARISPSARCAGA
jgi:hypothetical protein